MIECPPPIISELVTPKTANVVRRALAKRLKNHRLKAISVLRK